MRNQWKSIVVNVLKIRKHTKRWPKSGSQSTSQSSGNICVAHVRRLIITGSGVACWSAQGAENRDAEGVVATQRATRDTDVRNNTGYEFRSFSVYVMLRWSIGLDNRDFLTFLASSKLKIKSNELKIGTSLCGPAEGNVHINLGFSIFWVFELGPVRDRQTARQTARRTGKTRAAAY